MRPGMSKSVLALALIAFAVPQMALTGTALPQTKAAKSSGSASGGVYEQLNLFGEAFERIRNDAVEPVGDSKLVRTAISGMLSGLDPRSVYLTEAEYKALQSKAPEDSATTGLVLTMDNSIAKVVAKRTTPRRRKSCRASRIAGTPSLPSGGSGRRSHVVAA